MKTTHRLIGVLAVATTSILIGAGTAGATSAATDGPTEITDADTDTAAGSTLDRLKSGNRVPTAGSTLDRLSSGTRVPTT